jgi:hypothetical protein
MFTCLVYIVLRYSRACGVIFPVRTDIEAYSRYHHVLCISLFLVSYGVSTVFNSYSLNMNDKVESGKSETCLKLFYFSFRRGAVENHLIVAFRADLQSSLRCESAAVLREILLPFWSIITDELGVVMPVGVHLYFTSFLE